LYVFLLMVLFGPLSTHLLVRERVVMRGFSSCP
jgi:hypothetical protein